MTLGKLIRRLLIFLIIVASALAISSKIHVMTMLSRYRNEASLSDQHEAEEKEHHLYETEDGVETELSNKKVSVINSIAVLAVITFAAVCWEISSNSKTKS